jgi:hypothetical protein
MTKKAAKLPPRKPGRMLRPKAKVLRDSALVPSSNVVKKPPAKFSHQVKTPQPYYFELKSAIPDGQLLAGTRVKLEKQDGDDYCWVVTDQGLRVAVKCSGLRPILRKR